MKVCKRGRRQRKLRLYKPRTILKIIPVMIHAAKGPEPMVFVRSREQLRSVYASSPAPSSEELTAFTESVYRNNPELQIHVPEGIRK